MEPTDDRIARRLAEIPKEAASLDREAELRRDVENDTTSTLADRPKRFGFVRSTSFLIVIIATAAGLLGLAVTLSRLAGNDMRDAQRLGNAQVTSCVRHGPISNKGIGIWYGCTATITWDDGKSDRITVGAVFKTSDIGTTVRIGDLGSYRTAEKLARADTPYRPWLRWIGYVVVVVAFVPCLIATLMVRELLRFRRR